MIELSAEWIDYSQHLPVNTGMPFILETDNFEKNLYTTAHAMDSGWLWEIPTRNRIGRGYVYSDQFASEDDVIKELETKFQTGVKPVKSIKFNSGRLENVWIKNCVAIGLSAAFLEPLQATSIHCSIVQIKDLLLTCLNSTVEDTVNPIIVKNYNSRMSKLYSHVADFVSMHYGGGRTDTPFWNHVTTNLTRTPRAEEIIQLANLRLTRSFDFDVHDGYVGQWLWNYSLNGLGHFSKDTINGFFNNSTVDTTEIDNIVKMYLKETIENISHTYDLQTLNEKLQRDKE
jgi:tryptophan halogenase